MDKIESQVMPVPPNLITSLKAGFDSIANQVAIILIPIAIDLLIWLGPHLQVKTLINNVFQAIVSSSEISSIQSSDLLKSSADLINIAATRFNLLSLFRTIPVGIPSLMSGSLPVNTPGGVPFFIDITNPFSIVIISIALLLVGIMIGCFFYILVAQVALNGSIQLAEVARRWPKSFLKVVSLSLALLILFLTISIPSSCVISAIALFGLPLGQFAIFLFIGILLWLAFPLIFSAHGIFVNQNNALTSVQRSMMLTKMTLPSTSLFIVIAIAFSEGLDLLWRVPPETSWLTLVGVGGHAFITTSLLAASFIYYRDADHWVQETLKIIKSQGGNPLKSS